MPTLKAILKAEYGFETSDFLGSDGYVHVDMDAEAILGNARNSARASAVARLRDIFCPSQRVTLKAGPGRPYPSSFDVLAVDRGGLKTLNRFGVSSFVPWTTLRHGLSHPDQMVIDRPQPGLARPSERRPITL